MSAPFVNGTRVRYTGPLYDQAPQPVVGEVVGWNPISGHVSVLWDFYPTYPLLEYTRELVLEDNSPYRQGFYAAFSPSYPECPYADETSEHDQWYEGFGDGTDSYIENENYDDQA